MLADVEQLGSYAVAVEFQVRVDGAGLVDVEVALAAEALAFEVVGLERLLTLRLGPCIV